MGPTEKYYLFSQQRQAALIASLLLLVRTWKLKGCPIGIGVDPYSLDFFFLSSTILLLYFK